MLELIYPVDNPAPFIPANFEIAKQIISDEDLEDAPDVEVFPVVTPDGVVIGRATREYCHNGSKLLHPVVHLHLIDRDECIYLQKRSMTKDIQPGKWDTAVGGHVMYGESILEALYRESFEELALTDYNPVYLGSYCYNTGRDMEFVNIFAAVGHYNVTPDHNEVDEGRWIPLDKVEEMAKKKQLTPNFYSEFQEIRQKLLALL